jgi:hypothetical protein
MCRYLLIIPAEHQMLTCIKCSDHTSIQLVHLCWCLCWASSIRLHICSQYTRPSIMHISSMYLPVSSTVSETANSKKNMGCFCEARTSAMARSPLSWLRNMTSIALFQDVLQTFSWIVVSFCQPFLLECSVVNAGIESRTLLAWQLASTLRGTLICTPWFLFCFLIHDDSATDSRSCRRSVFSHSWSQSY